MLGLFAALANIFKPLEFPLAPVPLQARRAMVIYEKGKGPDRSLMEDRREIGWSFDGHAQQGVEDAIWISPTMLSRWLSYLALREGWTDVELQQRWAIGREDLTHRLTFVIRLASLPKLGLLDEDEVIPSEPENLDQLKFFATFVDWRNGQRRTIPLSGMRMETRRSEERSGVLKLPWYQYVSGARPALDPWPDATDNNFLGQNVGVIYVATGNLPDALTGAKKLELHVVSPRKERRAIFSLLNDGK